VDISNVPTTRTHVPLLAASVAAIRITVQTAPLASIPNVVPVPRKRVMEMPAATLVVNAAATTAAVNPATPAAMTPPGDAALLELRASQILINVPLEAQVLWVEAVYPLALRLLLRPSPLCCQGPLLAAVL